MKNREIGEIAALLAAFWYASEKSQEAAADYMNTNKREAAAQARAISYATLAIVAYLERKRLFDGLK